MAVHTDIQTLYLTVYNRPADWVGLLYWAEQLEASGLDAVNQRLHKRLSLMNFMLDRLPSSR